MPMTEIPCPRCRSRMTRYLPPYRNCISCGNWFDDDPVLVHCRQLSAGTIAGLVRCSRYGTIDAFRADLVAFVAERSGRFETWHDAVAAFQKATAPLNGDGVEAEATEVARMVDFRLDFLRSHGKPVPPPRVRAELVDLLARMARVLPADRLESHLLWQLEQWGY